MRGSSCRGGRALLAPPSLSAPPCWARCLGKVGFPWGCEESFPVRTWRREEKATSPRWPSDTQSSMAATPPHPFHSSAHGQVPAMVSPQCCVPGSVQPTVPPVRCTPRVGAPPHIRSPPHSDPELEFPPTLFISTFYPPPPPPPRLWVFSKAKSICTRCGFILRTNKYSNKQTARQNQRVGVRTEATRALGGRLGLLPSSPTCLEAPAAGAAPSGTTVLGQKGLERACV